MIPGKKKIKLTIGTAFLLFIILFGYAKSSEFLKGPTIKVSSPITGDVMAKKFITINGKAERIARLYLNDNQIFTDDNGNFSEPLLLLPGYNILELRAEDNFDREEVKVLEIVSPS